MLSIRCMGVGECQSEDPFVCFGTKPTLGACARDLHETGGGGGKAKSKNRIEESSQ